jgi:hypothetical protein
MTHEDVTITQRLHLSHKYNSSLKESNYSELLKEEEELEKFVPIQELTTSLCNHLALVHPEDGGDTILRNVGSYKSHAASSPRK